LRQWSDMGPAGDERLRKLAHEHSSKIASYLRRRAYPLSESDLDDLLEEVLVIAWRRIDDIPGGFELPWLVGVARNVLKNARRKDHRRRVMRLRLTPIGDSPSAEDQAIADTELDRALSRLKASDKEVLLLQFWDGLTVDEMAVALSITKNSAKVRLSRAMSRLRAILEEA
jgi:RNA polymerase sigma factor (sigma-70 family)